MKFAPRFTYVCDNVCGQITIPVWKVWGGGRRWYLCGGYDANTAYNETLWRSIVTTVM